MKQINLAQLTALVLLPAAALSLTSCSTPKGDAEASGVIQTRDGAMVLDTYRLTATVTALDVASRSVSNRHIAAQMADITRQVREGQPLSTAMAAKGEFPDVSVKMVEVGEATGALQDMLNAIADFYDEDIETRLGRFLLLIEPVLLVVMGVVIAALLIALYLPVFQLSSALS